jgi:hypothetical protein
MGPLFVPLIEAKNAIPEGPDRASAEEIYLEYQQKIEVLDQLYQLFLRGGSAPGASNVMAKMVVERTTYTAKIVDLAIKYHEQMPYDDSWLVHAIGTPPFDQFPDGLRVRLPAELGVVEAPNQLVADALRFALAQLGRTFWWSGGVNSGSFDAAHLIHDAYRAADNRFSLGTLSFKYQEIDKQPADDLLPGDLALWDGHVAMLTGAGHMIEAFATDVHLTPVRTITAGLKFLGYRRPYKYS